MMALPSRSGRTLARFSCCLSSVMRVSRLSIALRRRVAFFLLRVVTSARTMVLSLSSRCSASLT